VSEDVDDIFEKIRKYFKMNSDLFDMDFFVFPESNFDDDNNEKKGFKISYHYDSKMDQPEIKIEEDIDEEKLKKYFENHNIEPDSRFEKIFPPKNNNEIDAIELSLEPCNNKDSSCIIEPFNEINDADEYFEIVLEVPGIEQEDIVISLNDKDKNILFSTRNKKRNYQKLIEVPFKPTLKEYSLEVNNGLASLRFKK
jgi:HSP20 family molecular chaperone IbpA